MRLSGARPNRTWNIVVSSSTAASTQKVVDDRAVEGQDLVVDLGGVAGDRHQEAAVVAEIDVALDQPQPLVLRALHIALAAAVGIGRDAAGRRDAAARDPTASATTHLGLGAVEPRHLPVPARQRQLEQRLAERLAGLLDRNVGRGHVGDQVRR